MENIGLILAGGAVLALLVCGYASWRMNRRDEDAQQKAQRGATPWPNY
jgi:hypothetical protein